VSRPELAGIVVAWRARSDVEALAAAWPNDPRFELVVVDQSGDVDAVANGRVVRPGRNLGFAGGANFGARAASAGLLLFLNPDVRPEPGALAALADGFARYPAAAGLVPRLVGFDGAPQLAWQLRRLPSALSLLAHAFFVAPEAGRPGRAREPEEGTPIEQPAAAALALRRDRFEAAGGFDEAVVPAWFEDVDLARRLRDRRCDLLYLPSATFRHRLGSTVSELGYGAFLAAYDRNLLRYLAKHHGAGWATLFRALACAGALLRAALVPVWKPKRSASRREALADLVRVARGALDGWRPGAGGAEPAA
jgi:N-acetylglucosaminyl-diphospho-decaprenol L-rhamnosyltransferase